MACCRSILLLSLDTNVFDSRHGISDEQEYCLLSSLARKRVRIVFQIESLEECLIGLASDESRLRAKIDRQIRRLQAWCDIRRIAKPADIMLLDDIRAYCAGEGSAGAFL